MVFSDQAFIKQSVTDLDVFLKEFNDVMNPLKILGILDGGEPSAELEKQ